MRDMRYFIALLLPFFLVVGCRTRADLVHRVPIPRYESWGRSNVHSNSRVELYLHAYEESWWACVQNYATNIDFHSTVNDKAGSGWPSTIDGAWDGYTAAESRVNALIARFGKSRAQEILKDSLEYPNPDK
jgi:hypothetical protein